MFTGGLQHAVLRWGRRILTACGLMPPAPVDLGFLCSAVWVFIGPLGSLLGGLGVPCSALWEVHGALGSLLGSLWGPCSLLHMVIAHLHFICSLLIFIAYLCCVSLLLMFIAYLYCIFLLHICIAYLYCISMLLCCCLLSLESWGQCLVVWGVS